MAELNYSSGKQGGRSLIKKMPVRVDLTAMVDLAFLLITFFMLTTSLAKHREMPVNMPADGPAGPVGESSTMSICLGSHNKLLYYLGMPEKPLTTPTVTTYGKGIREAIAAIKARINASPDKRMTVIIKPATTSVYSNLVDILDEADISKVPSYSIGNITPQDITIMKQKGI